MLTLLDTLVNLFDVVINCQIFLSSQGTFCPWVPAWRQKMKMEKNQQTLLIQTAQNWSNCLKQDVSEVFKNTRNGSRTGKQSKRLKDIHLIWHIIVFTSLCDFLSLNVVLKRNWFAFFIHFSIRLQNNKPSTPYVFNANVKHSLLFYF